MSGDTSAVQVSRSQRVGLITIEAPETRNALTTGVMSDLVRQLDELDADRGTGCIVVAGTDRVFASGADIRMLAAAEPGGSYFGERTRQWESIRAVRTPLIAAVSGHCLGAGCELALSCDMIIASETASFGLPETALGLIPGAGGTLLLTRVVGKAIAMDVILSGRTLSSEEAEMTGLVARRVSASDWLDNSLQVARVVASRPLVAQMLAKESVRRALDVPLAAGIEAERNAFQIALSSDQAREGLAAFIDKREPQWDLS